MGFSKIYNPIVKLMLRSPLHSLVGKNTMLITFAGRKSGKSHTTPVNYVRFGDVIVVFSLRQRTWWRNLLGGTTVTVRMEGKDREAIAESIEDEKAVAAGLMAYLRKFPRYAWFFKVTLDSDGQPNSEEVAQSAKNKVMIRIKLAQ